MMGSVLFVLSLWSLGDTLSRWQPDMKLARQVLPEFDLPKIITMSLRLAVEVWSAM